jgi:hypothetical protein
MGAWHQGLLRQVLEGSGGREVDVAGDTATAAFVSQATASLLEDEELGDLEVRDVGVVQTRRTERAVRAFELRLPHRSSAG